MLHFLALPLLRWIAVFFYTTLNGWAQSHCEGWKHIRWKGLMKKCRYITRCTTTRQQDVQGAFILVQFYITKVVILHITNFARINHFDQSRLLTRSLDSRFPQGHWIFPPCEVKGRLSPTTYFDARPAPLSGSYMLVSVLPLHPKLTDGVNL